MEIDDVQKPEPELVKVPVFAEGVRINKRLIDTGQGVRIHKTVGAHPFEIDETLMREVVNVEHIAVDRIVPIDQAPATRYEGDTLVIPVMEEVLVVERRMRIKEEIHITRQRCEERYTETVQLKSEQVSVEHFDEADDNPSN